MMPRGRWCCSPRRRIGRRSLERLLSLAPVRPFIKPALIKQVAAKAPRAHYPAPYAMIDLWARNGAHGEAAFEAEARSIAAMFETPTSHNLIRVFLLQDRLKAQSTTGRRGCQSRPCHWRRRHGR